MANPVVPIPVASLDPSLITEVAPVEPAARGIPVDQMDPAKMGPTGPGIPVGQLNPEQAVSEVDYLNLSPRSEIVRQAREAQKRGETNLTSYEDAAANRAQKLEILDHDDRPDQFKPKEEPGTLESAARASGMVPEALMKPVQVADSAYKMYDTMAEGLISQVNEAARFLLPFDPMTARFATPAELKARGALARKTADLEGKPAAPANQTQNYVPGVTFAELDTNDRKQSLSNLIQGMSLAEFRAANMIRTFSNRVVNRLLYSPVKTPGEYLGESNLRRGLALASNPVSGLVGEVSRAVVGPGQPVDSPELRAVARTQFQHDLAAAMIEDGLKEGGGLFQQDLPASDPAQVEKVAASPVAQPTMAAPMFAGARSGLQLGEKVGVAGSVLENAAPPVIQHSISEPVLQALAQPIKVAGRIVQKTGQVVEGSPGLRAVTAGLGTLAAGAEPVTAALAALAGQSTKFSILTKAGGKLLDISASLAGKAPPGPMTRFGMSVAGAAGGELESFAAGQLANLPFVLGAGDEDSAKNLLMAGAIVHGTSKVGGAAASGLDVARNFWATKDTMPESRTAVKDYGIDPDLDAAHRKVVEPLTNSGNNLVQAVRDYFHKTRGELYTLNQADYNAALDRFVDQGVVTPVYGEAAKQQAGVTLPEFKGEDGKARNVALSLVAEGVPGVSVGHESGHLLERLFSDEERNHFYNETRKLYGDEQIADYKAKYEFLANQNLASGQKPVELTDTQVLSEIFAEHVGAVLNSIPVGHFSDRTKPYKDYARMIYGAVGRGLETIGVKRPELVDFSGESNSPKTYPKTYLKIEPSIKLAGIVENALTAHRLDLPLLKQLDAADAAEAASASAPPKKPAATDEQRYLNGKPPGETPATTETKGPPHPISTESHPFVDDAPGIKVPVRAEDVVPGRHEDGTHQLPTETGETKPNVRTTAGEQNKFGEATPETVEHNTGAIDANLAKGRGESRAFEADMLSAKSDVKGPDQVVREDQRLAADAAEAAAQREGKPNPLRSVYQKVFVPYRWVNDQKSHVWATSMDKVIQNVDLFRGWLEMNPKADASGKLRAYLTGPEITKDISTYLKNQSNGYAGDGSRLVRPAETDPKLITPENPNYTPVKLDSGELPILNLLMGVEQPGKQTPAQALMSRFAEANGFPPTEINGVTDTNSLRANLRINHGFNPRLLNSAVENLKVSRLVSKVKPRPDLNFSAGDSGLQRAGFMPKPEETARKTENDAQGSFMPRIKQDELGFRSQLEDTLRAIPEKASRSQIEAALRDGVKEKGQLIARPPRQEELNDVKDAAGTSFAEWMSQNPQATRQEMIDFATEHRVKVGEKILGNQDAEEAQAARLELRRATQEVSSATMTLVRKAQEAGLTQLDVANLTGRLDDGRIAVKDLPQALWPHAENYLERHKEFIAAKSNRHLFDEPGDGTKYENYQLSGGQNYREAVLTLPADKVPERYVVTKQGPYVPVIDTQTGHEVFHASWGKASEWAHAKNQELAGKNNDYRSPHFRDVPGYLAHARFNERTAASGEKVLHAEELQSDLHQAGRKYGYANGDDLPLVGQRPPDAPFKKSWHELTFKYLLRKAAEANADYLSWTTGEQQAERYDLSKQVDSVYARKRDNGTYSISVTEKGKSGLTGIAGEATEAELTGLVGKDLAEKIAKQEASSAPKKYDGLDLKVGGEGMKGFYDKILPEFANKYLKRFGGKTEEIGLGAADSNKFQVGHSRDNLPVVTDREGMVVARGFESEAQAAAKVRELNKTNAGIFVHAVRLTPELKQELLDRGQPAYMPKKATVLDELKTRSGIKDTLKGGGKIVPFPKKRRELEHLKAS